MFVVHVFSGIVSPELVEPVSVTRDPESVDHVDSVPVAVESVFVEPVDIISPVPVLPVPASHDPVSIEPEANPPASASLELPPLSRGNSRLPVSVLPDPLF